MTGQFICSKCNYKTTRKFNLTKHLRIHREEKPYSCSTCDSSFADASNLNKHKTKCSGGAFRCDKCQETFSSASLVTRHRNQSKLNLPFRCTNCCGSFKTEKNLNTHIMSKHSSGTKTPSASNAGTTPTNQATEKTRRQVHFQEEDDIEEFPQTQYPSKSSGEENIETASNSRRLGTTKRPPPVGNNKSTGKKQKVHGSELEIPHQLIVAASESTVSATVTIPEDEDLFLGFTQAGSVVNVVPASPNRDDEDFNELELENEELEVGKIVKNGNCRVKNPDLLFRLWKMKRSFSASKEKLSPEALSACELVYQESKHDSSVYIIDALENGLNELIGIFPTAMILFDFLHQLSPDSLVSFYKESQELQCFHPSLKELVKLFTVFKLQQNLFTILSDSTYFRGLPLELTEKLSFEEVFEENIEKESKSSKATAVNRIQDEIYICIQDMINLTLFAHKQTTSTFYDDSYSNEDRQKTWTLFLKSARENYASECPLTLPDLVMMSARLIHDCTIPYLNVKTENYTLPLHLHPEVLGSFSLCTEKELETVVATRQDVDTFVKLLYTTDSMQNRKGLITTGLYELAKGSNIENTWSFLFGNATLEETLTTETACDIFRIALKLKRQDDVKLAWKFVTTLSSNEKFASLNGLDSQQIEFFFSCNCIENEMEKYEMLLNWAYDASSELFPPMEKITFNPTVASAFDSVKKILKIRLLKRNVILRHCYITFNDFVDAEKAN